MKQGRLLFLGDSLLADFNWQDRITHFEVLNLSVFGETPHGLLNRLPSIQEQVIEPHIILIMTGTNSLLMEDYNFTETMRQIVVSLSHYYPSAEVIINSLIPLQIPWLDKNEMKRINSAMEALSLQSGCCFLDMYAKFSTGTGLFQADGIHFTEKGYNLWARSILEYIAFLLEDD
ncbi:MAG: GDSL-type esterase/lipase family protein [Pseudomonadota bacterium]